MPVVNLIVNGSFDQGDAGWSGVDLETNYTESAYFGGSSTNRLAEMDGTKGKTTVMWQSVDIPKAGTFHLDFRTALRDGQPLANNEGFLVQIFDQNNVAIFTHLVQPQQNSWQTLGFDITFPQPGPYKISFTETGVDNSYGAVIDDIRLLVCFTAGTLIETPTGPRPVELLQTGDLVLTSDGKAMALQWTGSRHVTAQEQKRDPGLRPVVFEPGSLGEGLPRRRLAVSPQHRMLISGWKAELWFAETEVLVPARALINDRSIRQAQPDRDVIYVHFLLDGHQIVLAEGCPSESFHPGEQALGGLDQAARDEVLRLFPDLETAPMPAARQVIRRKLAAVLAA